MLNVVRSGSESIRTGLISPMRRIKRGHRWRLTFLLIVNLVGVLTMRLTVNEHAAMIPGPAADSLSNGQADRFDRWGRK
jgi:hypothetical protein